MPTPNAKIYLLSTNLDSKNQLKFNDTNTQRTTLINNYCKITIISTPQTFVREDQKIKLRINKHSQDLLDKGINYVIYQNTNYSNKWYYAYVKSIDYVSNTQSLLTLETDVFQTWQFDFEIKTAFVVREHVINDDLFKHTIPENLPTGEQITVATTTIADNLNAHNAQEFDENYYCVIMTSEPVKWLSTTIPSLDSFVGGVANPCYMYATNLSDFYGFMNKITENGQVSAVVCCVAIPKFFVNFHELDTGGGGGGGGGETGVNYLGSPYSTSFNITQTYNPPNHYGIDMVGLSDKNIYTPVSGTVVDSRWENDSDHSQGYGQLVRILDSESGLYFIFGHLSERSVSQGDTVTAGQKIGVEGTTGYSTGSHLHYQVSSDWHTETVNPANYGTFQNIEGVQ